MTRLGPAVMTNVLNWFKDTGGHPRSLTLGIIFLNLSLLLLSFPKMKDRTLWSARYRIITNVIGMSAVLLSVYGIRWWGKVLFIAGVGTPGTTDDGFTTPIILAPFTLTCLLVNMRWMLEILSMGSREWIWPQFSVWLAIFIAWNIILLDCIV